MTKKTKIIAKRIGITGTPGTGKKSVGIEFSKLTGFEFVSINELAIKNKAGRWRKREYVVQPSKLRGKIDTEGKVVCGHLLPYVVPARDIDFVAILRCSPLVLRKRFVERSYPSKKVRENLESELLDLISLKSLEVYGRNKVFEFDTTRIKNPKTVARRIVETLRGERKRQFGLATWSRVSGESPVSLAKFVEE